MAAATGSSIGATSTDNCLHCLQADFELQGRTSRISQAATKERGEDLPDFASPCKVNDTKQAEDVH